MTETVLLAVLNAVQVIFLGYLSYRVQILKKDLNGHGHG